MKTWIIAAALMAAFAGAAAQGQTPVRARDVVKEFNADKAAAMKKYAGRPIVVTGDIGRINHIQLGYANIILDGPSTIDGLLLWLADGDKAARTLAVGQTVTLRCVFDKLSMLGQECRIQR